MLCDLNEIKFKKESEINLVAATLSVLHHGEEHGDDAREDGEEGGQPGDEDAVRFFVYVNVNVYETLGFGALKNEGVEEVGIGHLCLLIAIKAATTQIPILATKRKRLIQKVRRLIWSLVKGV